VTELCHLVGAENAEALRRRWLHEADVAVLADRQFGPPVAGEGHHIRFSYATSEENIASGLQRLEDWIGRARR
jgi:aspartate/methionine/tyrosine aminotransferase